MRKLLIALMAALSVSAIAQGPQNGGMSPELAKQMREMKEVQMQKMIKELKLTKDQQKKFRAIDASTEPKLRKLMSEPGDMSAKRPKLMKIVSDSQAELKKILTKDQWAKYQKMMAEQMKLMSGSRPKG